MMKTIKENTENINVGKKIGKVEQNLINEYLSNNVKTFEEGITEYEVALDDYGCIEYLDGHGFQQTNEYYQDWNVPSKGKQYTEFDEWSELITHIRKELKL